mmetsp:Transcript_41077/g.85743  ORF Transcript_41077/g.85743 Transcript_41077/m.85743 type:complete len:86 (-) Transcript_41077:28-285(-)
MNSLRAIACGWGFQLNADATFLQDGSGYDRIQSELIGKPQPPSLLSVQLTDIFPFLGIAASNYSHISTCTRNFITFICSLNGERC